MGRPYQQELNELASTRARIPAAASAQLSQAAIRAAASGLMVVASGGAKVIAEWACRLHRLAFGIPAVALTPLEYAALAAPVRASTWLVSAGGRHPDIHQAVRAARQRGDACLIGVVGQADTPLQDWLAQECGAATITLQLPADPDGFLATNSVWSMACVLAEAYAPWLPKPDVVGLTETAFDEALRWAANKTKGLADSPAFGNGLVVLHDVWNTLGAQDLETRLIEASLSDLWLADFRNFGHGRHFWIADRPERTSLVALWTPSADNLAERTLAQLPENLHVVRVRIPYVGVIGALTSLAWSIHATASWAQAHNRDPGRPGVPAFGERLYEGGFPYPRFSVPSLQDWAIRRKVSGATCTHTGLSLWQEAYRHAVARVEQSVIPAVVMDFDGTLVESAKRYDPLEPRVGAQLRRLLKAGVWIGIATGRGDSVQTRLQEVIPKHLRSRVLVGYHNGAKILFLDEVVDGLDGAPADPQFQTACDVLERELQVMDLATLRVRARQLTLTPASGQALEDTWRMAKESLGRHGLTDIGVWLSSHSVDVVASVCSKLYVVNQVAALAGCAENHVLRIGDRGAWPGNDWQLLSAPLGLSVDQCSADPNSCWNLVPPGLRGPHATVYLLDRLQRTDAGMQFNLEEHRL